MPTCDTHVSWGRRFSHRTKAQSRAEDNDLPGMCSPSRLARAPPAGDRFPDRQMLHPAGGKVPPRTQVLLPAVFLLPMTLCPPTLLTRASRTVAAPSRCPCRAGARRLPNGEGGLACPWVPCMPTTGGRCCHLAVREPQQSLPGGQRGHLHRASRAGVQVGGAPQRGEHGVHPGSARPQRGKGRCFQGRHTACPE